MKPELDSFAIDDKYPRPAKKRIFHLRPVYAFAECEMEFSGIFSVFQCFWVRQQRRDPVRSDISINNRIDQRGSEVTPAFMAACFAGKPRHQLPLQRSSNSGKIDARTDCSSIARSNRLCELPKRNVRRRCVNQQSNDTDDQEPANQSHFKSNINRIRARLKAMRGRIAAEKVLRETSCMISV